LIKTVLIGLGKVGAGYSYDPKTSQHIRYSSHAQVLKEHPKFECIAAIDVAADTLWKEAEALSIPNIYPDISALNDEPQLAVIATPPNVRLDIIKTLPSSIEAIILEKPLAVSLDEADKIIQYCNQRGIVIEVNYWRRFDNVLREWRDQFKDKIGQVQAGLALYGGGLLNNGSHVIDCLRYLCGEFDYIQQGLSPGSFHIKFKTGGCVAVSSLDFENYREIAIDLWGTHGRFELVQESLMIRHSVISPHRAMSGNIWEIDSLQSEVYESGAGYAMYHLYDQMAAIIENGVRPKSSAQNALQNHIYLDQLLR
jgi:predicted dehydrogenase